MNREKFVNKYVDFLHENQKVLFTITTLALLLFTYMATQIEVSTSFDNFFYDNDPTVLFNNKVEAAFNSKDSVTIMIRINDSSEDNSRITKLDDKEIIEYIDKITEKITQKSFIDGVIDQNINPSLLSEDKRTSLIVCFMNFKSEEKYNKEKLNQIQEIIDETPTPSGVKISLGGEQILLDEISRLIFEDLLVTGAITLVVVAILVKLFLKYNNTTIFSTIVNFFTIMSLLGIMEIVGMNLNMATALIAALMIGLGVDYSLHIMNGFNDENEKNKKMQIKKTFLEVSPSLFMSFITTFIGFASLFFAGSKIMGELGMVTCLGMIFVFVLNHFYLPLLHLMFSKEESLKNKRGVVSKFIEKIEHKLPRTDQLISNNPYKFILSIFALTIIIVSGMSFLETNTTMSDFLPAENQVVKDLNTQMQIFEGTDNYIQIVATSDNVLDPTFIKKLDSVCKEIMTVDHVTSTSGLNDEIRELNNGALPDYKMNFETLPSSVSSDLEMTLIKVYYDSSVNADQNKLLEEVIPEIIEKLPDTYQLTGTIALEVGQREIMKTGQMNTILFSFVIIFILLLLYFKSLIKSIIVLFPVIFAIIATQGLNGWAGIPFNQITSAIFGMIIGLGIDYGIHTIVHMSKALEKNDAKTSLKMTFGSLGKLLFVTSLTTIFGFLSLQFASLSLLRDMGITLAFGIIMALVYSVILLPAIVIVEKDIEEKVKSIILKIKSIAIK